MSESLSRPANQASSSPGEPRPFAAQARTYQEGELIVVQDEPLQGFFVILDGHVRISREDRRVRVLKQKDVFGMEAMVHRGKCPYSARAMTPCRVLFYEMEAFDDFLYARPQAVRDLVRSLLRQLTDTSLAVSGEESFVLSSEVEVRHYRDGETIISEGEESDEFYRLISSTTGLRVTLRGIEIGRIDQPGEFFGEMACLLKAPRQATVTSMGDSLVQVYRPQRLESIVGEDPQLAMKLIGTLARRLSSANIRLTEKEIKSREWKDFV
ncbi:cyclic nucleotide-binding domain-containing protein [Desulfosoma caldarium]|uniref:Cyclic nucleotide-binding protein n=1 Tax=Desulfosoma caldarium TaxID=610254 RepID=A0A3N1VKN5_9BACT|nr:cyclic nucleotide-binding domain-containing protein [Desulfosoma caldarium]ROR01558.1 cyclic nucleotide-binding protein [Desulfosoma caldarium]